MNNSELSSFISGRCFDTTLAANSLSSSSVSTMATNSRSKDKSRIGMGVNWHPYCVPKRHL